MEHAVQSENEIEVRNALAAYKAALINTNHRSLWHRVMCFLGDEKALDAESKLQRAHKIVTGLANKSEDHKRIVRLISSQQPESVRENDKFLDLIQKA